ncbi:MAG: type II secretion system protein GspG [Acidobacteriota bacterium]|nr:type II secretion system protein GspG [Acidobacteriota bacterium]
MSHVLMQNGRDRERSGSGRGFGLLETVVALAIVAAAVALVAPALAGMTRRSTETSTQQQEQDLNTAIFGAPWGGTFGFTGDVGRLPTSLTELVSQESLPAFHTADGATAHIGNVGYGWNGPYLGGLFSNANLVTDPWGQAFSYAGTGASAGRVISGGADGTVGTTDDVAFPFYAPATTGTLFVVVVVNGIANPLGVAAKVYYPVNGEQAVTATQKFDPNAPNSTFDGFAFTSVVPGVRVVVATHTDVGGGGGSCSTTSRTVPISIIPGQTNIVQIAITTMAQARVLGAYQCTIPD